MNDLFRIETNRATIRWSTRSSTPATFGRDPRSPGFLSVLSTGNHSLIYAPANEGVAPKLFEQTDYRLSVRAKGTVASRVEVRHRDPDLVRDLLPVDEGSPDLCIGTLNFRNQVGRSRFDIFVDGQFEVAFEVEVFPSKLNYREDYEQLLAEVQGLLTALAFEYLRATYAGAERTDVSNTELEWAIQLGSVIDSLERGLHQIARQPTRSLRRESRMVRAGNVRRPDSAILRAARTGAGEGPWIEFGGLRIRSRLPTTHPEPTLDTPEHRWLSDNLDRARRRLGQLTTLEAARPQRGGRRETALQHLRAIESRLSRLATLEPLVAATTTPPPGFTSLQLLAAPGYRESYRALVALQLGLRVEGNALELSLKDISTLYEYWCYLALLELVSGWSGVPIDPRKLLDLNASGLQVLLRKGRRTQVPFVLNDSRILVAEYNPTYSGHVLLSQHPDIVLSLHDKGLPTTRIVLDAKYRADASPENVRQLGVVGPPADALNVLHRYRDAILTDEPTPNEAHRVSRSVVYAAALYPAAIDLREFSQSRLSRQLVAVGIGAIPFLPSNRDILANWLDRVLGQGQWALAQAGRPAASERWVWHAATEIVLVGPLRSKHAAEATEHLHWALETCTYYVPLTQARHGRQLNPRYVALYVPADARDDGVGAVAWLGEVHDVQTVPRTSLSTPWPARDATEQVLRYSVASWQLLPAPIKNIDSVRVSAPRWSTRLALERAETIEQLLLESPLEWALFDALRVARVRFRVRADSIPTVNTEHTRGRARFHLDDGRVARYAGTAGFEVCHGGISTWCATVERTAAELSSR